MGQFVAADQVLGGTLQSLLDSRTTPQDCLATLEAAYTEHTAG